MTNNDIIGIFYIATGIYKKYFNEFLNTIHYCFPNKTKKLIIISDGLTEYNNMYINGVNIIVEDFIDYPYPYINVNKLQIIHHYAQKYNINNIIYFDSETFFIEKDEEFYNNILAKSKNKFVSLIPGYLYSYTFRDIIWSMNNYTLWGQDLNFRDFDYFYQDLYNYDNIDMNYKWIQTSFFICSFDILTNINNLVKKLILYNNRITGYKLNYSDEFFVNYLNLYYPELFEADFYSGVCVKGGGNNVQIESTFFNQKQKMLPEKYKLKFGNSNVNFRMVLIDTNNSEAEINKFFINHIDNFLLYNCNCNTINNMIFFQELKLNDIWFNNNNENIILARSFYSESFFKLYNRSKTIYIGFVHKINEYSNNFDYDDFYNNEYDYIEGYSFDDIKNMKFNDIDMCCFSKKYIEAYFNNDKAFKPKIYKI